MNLLPARIAVAAIVATIAVAVATSPASAIPASVTIAGITYQIDGAVATATAYDPGAGGDSPFIEPRVTIGGTEYDVTTIGDYAFSGFDLIAVTIPDTVTSIGELAFSNNLLSSLTIGDSVTTIGPSAFADNLLSSLTIGDGVTTIGDGVFADNLLSSLTIGDGVTTIGGWAFSDNPLSSLTIGDSVTTIGPSAFADNKLGTLVIPSSVTEVSNFAFGPNKLSSLIFEGDAPSIGFAAFGVDLPSDGPLVSYYARNSGFTAPTWTAGQAEFRSQALATVTFDANGHGTTPTAVDVVVDDTVAEPTDPTETGYTFDGWFDAATGGNAFAFATPITEDLTLFAQWSEVVPDPTPTPTAAADTEVAVAAGAELADTGATNTGLIWTAGLLLALGAPTLTLRARRARS
ncbi:leucine-rich repeat protein [Demequina aurantiaca]|uniref:leucine-rich repeat protein n=1 Tax=Demequina aurantiaca TaxID=676200 RepID=UPI003D32547E